MYYCRKSIDVKLTSFFLNPFKNLKEHSAWHVCQFVHSLCSLLICTFQKHLLISLIAEERFRGRMGEKDEATMILFRCHVKRSTLHVARINTRETNRRFAGRSFVYLDRAPNTQRRLSFRPPSSLILIFQS